MGVWAWIKALREGSPAPALPAQADTVAELCDVLRAIIRLLEEDDETHWRAWMMSSLTKLEANELRGARHLLGAYGGMGAFNDLIIGQRVEGDAFKWADGAQQSNDELTSQRGHAWYLADELINTTSD